MRRQRERSNLFDVTCVPFGVQAEIEREFQTTGVYALDPYLGPRASGGDEEMTKLRKEINSLKAENTSLKARLRGDHTLFGAGAGRGSRGGFRGSRTACNALGSTAGRSFQYMSVNDKQAVTCLAWNSVATPGASGGCTNKETNGYCEKDGVKLRHACSVIKPGERMFVGIGVILPWVICKCALN